MKILKKILTTIIIILTTTTVLTSDIKENISVTSNADHEDIIEVAVIMSNFSDTYTPSIRENIEKFQKENYERFHLTFFDGKGNQDTQNKIINSTLQNDFDILLVNLVDTTTHTIDSVMSKIKPTNLPIIFFGIEPFMTDSIKSHAKAVVIGTDVDQSGTLQGKIIADFWQSNKDHIDKNSDDLLQYVMLAGLRHNEISTVRAKNSILQINNSGIKTQELAFRISDETENEVRSDLESILIRHGFNDVEVIITTNDNIAISAIKELQEYGYNKGDKRKIIPVFGINGTSEAKKLIKEGFMTGTIAIDMPSLAKAILVVSNNLIYGKNPLEGTDYKFDTTGDTVIKIPYSLL